MPTRLRSRAAPHTAGMAEKALWALLRDRRLEVKFRRQHPIAPYTADFACVDVRLVVEVDGSSHRIEEEIARDLRRTTLLEQKGWRVLRLSDDDVLRDPGAVLDQIRAALTPSP